MKEIICLHIGQAGVQMGNSIWELLSVEHGMTEAGLLKEPSYHIECLNTFFNLSHRGNYVPRSIFVDLEPSVIDEIRAGSFRKLFHPDRLISGPEDAASNFARGFFTVGKLLLGVISHEMRKLLETGSNTEAIFIFRSLGGGTGSGLTSAIFDSLIEYPKITKIEMPIYPSPSLSTAMVEPYNCLLSEHFCMEDIDVGLLLDNEALYDICSKYLSISQSSYSTINRLISQLTSSITASARFESVSNCDLSVLQTNLIPYPRIHFPLANFAPVLSEAKANHEELSVNDLTRAVFEKENQMMKIDHSFGRFMSCSLFFRGDVSPYHVYIALNEIKRDKNIEFVDWCPTGFKVGINICPPTVIPASEISQTTRNVTMLANTSAIGQAWQRLTHKFYLLYSKRSFVHWFVGEGMEECEFTESLYNISALIKDYEEVVSDVESKPEVNQQNEYHANKKIMKDIGDAQKNMDMNMLHNEVESDLGKSCIKYQVSVSEPEVEEEQEEEINEEETKDYEDKDNFIQHFKESSKEDSHQKVEETESDDLLKDIDEENQNYSSLRIAENNNCSVILNNITKFKKNSLKTLIKKYKKSIFIIMNKNKKSSKTFVKKRRGNYKFNY